MKNRCQHAKNTPLVGHFFAGMVDDQCCGHWHEENVDPLDTCEIEDERIICWEIEPCPKQAFPREKC
jgi:hypothetical protein